MTTNITIQEADYVDKRADNDKFFRTFAFGSAWVTQYGRNGTIGTFTKIIEAASPKAAQQAADAKYASKVKKGYSPRRSGVVVSPFGIDSTNVTALDELAEALPEGNSSTIVSKPIAAVDLGDQRTADLTATVSAKLTNVLTGSTAISTDTKPLLPMRPMLASVQAETTIAAAMLDAGWVAQFKYDGDRVVIEITDGEVRILNRQGEEKVKNVGSAHLRAFGALHLGRWVFDGEVVGRTLVLYDMAAATDGTTTWIQDDAQFAVRYCVLKLIAELLAFPEVATASETEPVVLAPTAYGIQDKADFLATAVAEHREGIILRHIRGLYEPGRRSTTLVKHKLIKDADVVISGLHGTKASATLAVHDAAGDLIEIGSVSTNGKGEVSVGDVWMVTFLYVTDPEHPHLFQPRLVKKRDDKSAAVCTIDQFADAGTSRKV